jgi:hypothetical protein
MSGQVGMDHRVRIQPRVRAVLARLALAAVGLLPALGEGGTSGGPACGPLPAPADDARLVRVGPSRAHRLPEIVASAQPGTTILLEDGTYRIGRSSLAVRSDGITIRSRSGNRAAVILDGHRYETQTMISIQASRVTVADLTIRDVHHHAIHVSGGGHHVRLHNLHVLDARQQFIKVNPDTAGRLNDHGLLACSLLELTDAGRAYVERHPTPGFPCYTGGLVAHQAWQWVVRDNVFRNIYCSAGKGLAQHAVHFWKTSGATTVERNRVLNCARGIGFGLGPEGGHRGYPDLPPTESGPAGHLGGAIRNNVIWSNVGRRFDTGIGLEQASGVTVDHNTIFADAGFSSIDVRFSASDTLVRNNLYNIPMTIRDGGRPKTDRNGASATAEMFVDAAAGDLHLRGPIGGVVDGGLDLRREIPADLDGEPRDELPDIGADEYRG